MNNNTLKEIMYIMIAILIGGVLVKFIIWLLPIMLTIILGYYIYTKIKKNKKKTNKTQKKNKPIKIIDMEIEENK